MFNLSTGKLPLGKSTASRTNPFLTLPYSFAAFASSSKGIRRLVSVNSPISVVVDALDLLSLMACGKRLWTFGQATAKTLTDVELFRPLLSLKPEQNSQEAVDPKKPPLVDALCVYLKQDHSEASVQTVGQPL